MSARLPRRLPILAAAVLAGALLGACKPWTVVPIEKSAEGGSTPRALDARGYVESIWTSQVLPEARTSALEAGEALAGSSASDAPRFLRGEGTVVKVDRSSRVGLALVDLAPGDGEADVALQIGPVIRGMALRDTLSFVRFSDFANQLEFADVGNALNDRVMASVLEGLDPASLEGRRVAFWGAAGTGAAGNGRVPEVVPVVIERQAP